MIKQIFVLLMLMIVVYACKHQVINPQPTTDPTTPPIVGDTTSTNTSGLVCFESQVLPIFTSNCAKSGCHNAASKNDGYQLDSYNNIINSNRKGIKPGDPGGSDIYKYITTNDVDKRMPYQLPPLSAANIAIIKQWIIEGAQNTTNCGSTCNSDVFTFSGAVKPIIDTYCKGCHTEPATANKPNFVSYEGIRAVALDRGRLVGAISHKPGFTPMPQAGPQLSDCKILQITKWVNAGAPNN